MGKHPVWCKLPPRLHHALSRVKSEPLSCDYAIVGAGSAGCVLAGRLSESPDVSVVLLEAGGSDRSPLIAMPMGESHLIGGRHDWSFETEPEERLDGFRFTMPRGRVLGGSSSINGQVYSRGHPRDYDEWRQLGCEGWSFDDVLPFFRRAESWEEGGDSHRGGEGPLQTTRGRFEHPLYDAFLRAGESLGYGRTPDYNGARQEGFGRVQYTHTHRGLRRCSSAHAYLRPARRRPNLEILTRVRATRVLLEGGRAVGVEYRAGGERLEVRAEREVLVCAGSYQSPQLLMLSGIGAPDALRELGIAPRHPLPAVGEGLQDHFGSFVQHECRQPITFYRYRNPLRFAGALAEYLFLRQGPLTVFPMDAVAHLRSDPALERPDIQIYLCPMRVNPIREGSLWPREHGFNLHWNLLRPESRGRVSLRSADPLAPPRIWHNYLATAGDRRLNRRALEMCREILADEAFAPYRGRETEPGAECATPADIDAFMIRMPNSGFHPVGTCRMGGDEAAVVDPRLRVRGLSGLRVVDASVMPRLVGGNTNAPTIMIAEKAADLIREDAAA